MSPQQTTLLVCPIVGGAIAFALVATAYIRWDLGVKRASLPLRKKALAVAPSLIGFLIGGGLAVLWHAYVATFPRVDPNFANYVVGGSVIGAFGGFLLYVFSEWLVRRLLKPGFDRFANPEKPSFLQETVPGEIEVYIQRSADGT